MSKTGSSIESKLRSIRLVHEDDSLIVVDKPAGMAVHAGAGASTNLIDVLRDALGGAPLHPVHRLDRATSGLVVIARSPQAARALSDRWAEVDKRYLAMALGSWTGPDAMVAAVRSPKAEPKPARTTVLGSAPLSALDPEASLLLLRLESGRMHQIRQHLASLGHPILLDDKYGDFAANRRFLKWARTQGAPLSRKTMLLHAYRLKLPHPESGQMLRWKSPPRGAWEWLLDRAEGSVDVISQLH